MGDMTAETPDVGSKSSAKAQDDSASSTKALAATVIGIAILFAFAAFIVYLLRNLDLNDTQWSRAIYLFAGVEAVAFSAAGYFFGTQVQRGRVDEAKTEANAARAVKDAAQETAKANLRTARSLATGIVNAQGAGGLLSGPSGTGVSEGLVAQAQQVLRD